MLSERDTERDNHGFRQLKESQFKLHVINGISLSDYQPWKSVKSTYVPPWDQTEGAWLWTPVSFLHKKEGHGQGGYWLVLQQLG
jgi:hypothetical protein